jgi:HEAT repeats
VETNHPTINWPEIARAVGALDESGAERGCGSETARAALELLLGPDMLRQAVDHYVAFKPGFMLVRNVLWLLHPWSAMLRCYEIYKSDNSLETRGLAVELLKVVADSRAIPWIYEFLADPEPDIQNGGVGILDQILWGGGAREEDCDPLLKLARNHSSPYVRQRAEYIDGFLKERNA